ncbi:MAG: hypothetical protein HYR97_01280 [Candidatus Melainabacteria bacterium]|nr:hypothetical protein [Candidatus Melainabacteria bacterium]MBI3308442.1 hypothetical protein [Candidatus Melainabacteria bacterium]
MPAIIPVVSTTQRKEPISTEKLTDGEREALWNDGGPGLRDYQARQKRLQSHNEPKEI